LGLLTQHPGSGYDLLRRFEKSMGNVWSATQSQLYGELNKLAAAGLIEVADEGPRGRKEYAVTDAGRAELLRWISTPEVAPARRPDLLRVFLLGELPPDRARAHAVAIAEHADAELLRLRQLDDSVSWDDTDGDFYARSALEYGLATAAMEGQWARTLVTQIDARSANRK
jgi:DNA-binding PadR family transcriptional regulator